MECQINMKNITLLIFTLFLFGCANSQWAGLSPLLVMPPQQKSQQYQQQPLTFEQQLMLKSANSDYRPQTNNLTFQQQLMLQSVNQGQHHQTTCTPIGNGAYDCSGTSY